MMMKLALVSLVLASKLKNSLKTTLKYTHIESAFQEIQAKDLIKIERYVLIQTNFNINVVTPYDYVMIFFKSEEIFPLKSIIHKMKIKNELIEILIFFTRFYFLNEFTSLALAIICLMICRSNLNIFPIFPKHLESLTESKEVHFKSLFSKLNKMFKMKKNSY